MKKKYGIYLTYAPEQGIRNQGLGRLLAFIIKGAIANGSTFVLAYPKWHVSEMEALYKDQKIDVNKIEIITTNGIPFLIRIKIFLEKLGKKENNKMSMIKKISDKSVKSIANMFIWWLGLSNIFLFILIGTLLLIITIVLLPLFIILAFLAIIMLFSKRIITKIIGSSKLNIIFGTMKSLKNYLFAHTIYEKILHQESLRLIHKINKRKDIPAWLVPTLFWPNVKYIHSKKVIVAPDIILYDFPTQYNTKTFSWIEHKLQHTISVADHLITYSQYVKDEHLQKPFGIADDKITVVHHGASDLSEDLKDKNALEVLIDYQKYKLKHDLYLNCFNLENIKYIFFSSQIRVHKNFLNLLKAYKILLRERFVNIKLITTADLKSDISVKNYIEEHNLEKDILGFYNVSSKVLAALNAQAICSVNPTLFEGGFPFTFLEAYTVGTPSLMGDIPMTSELIDNSTGLKEKMLFNPYLVNDMADKIEWGINHHQELFKIQNELFIHFKERSWSDCASDYIKVLDNVSR